jgi:hypothetical protein
MTIHAFAQAGLAILRDDAWVVVLRDEIVQIVVRLKEHIAAAPAVAAIWATFGTILLTPESNATFSPVPGARVDFKFVDEHGLMAV